MRYERQRRLVERLLEKTRAGELDWQESVGSDAFQVSLSKHGIQIVHANSEYHDVLSVRIIDSYGKAVDIFDDQDLTNERDPSNGTWHSVMTEIFEAARRKALKADEALDGILAEMSR